MLCRGLQCPVPRRRQPACGAVAFRRYSGINPGGFSQAGQSGGAGRPGRVASAGSVNESEEHPAIMSSPPKIHIERMMYRSSIAVAGESAASYALVKLIPAGGGGKALGLNLALVLDVSGSMYEEDGTGIPRLKRVQSAAKSAIQKLKPSDSLAVVGFAYNASVLLPSTSLSDKTKITETIDKVDMFDVDPGGTSMDQG